MTSEVAREHFASTPEGHAIERFTLTNAKGVRVAFLSYGGVIQSLLIPGRDGSFTDVVLGYDTLDEYRRDRSYFGAIVGRYANRIRHGRFTVDGREYALANNNGANHLHGGARGFGAVPWQVEPFAREAEAGATLSYVSPDGEEGYPGAVHVQVTYTLTDANDLVVDYLATTSAPTPINLTQHTYFNLAGDGTGEILDHELTLYASRFIPTDEAQIPTGELRDVRNTPFDFTTPHLIGERIGAAEEQLRRGGGYDHTFVLDRSADVTPSLAARLAHRASGRVVEVYTTEPGIQFFSGNTLGGGLTGKGGRPYAYRSGLALETQHFPDSPNQPHFPSTILRPGETLRSRTLYRFLVHD